MGFKKCTFKSNASHNVEYCELKEKPKKYVQEKGEILHICHPVTKEPKFSILKADAKFNYLIVNHTLQTAFPSQKKNFKKFYDTGVKSQKKEDKEEKKESKGKSKSKSSSKKKSEPKKETSRKKTKEVKKSKKKKVSKAKGKSKGKKKK